jgi:hypothetical protein
VRPQDLQCHRRSSPDPCPARGPTLRACPGKSGQIPAPAPRPRFRDPYRAPLPSRNPAPRLQLEHGTLLSCFPGCESGSALVVSSAPLHRSLTLGKGL